MIRGDLKISADSVEMLDKGAKARGIREYDSVGNKRYY